MPVIKAKSSRRTFVAAGLASGCALGMPVTPAQSQNRSRPVEATIRADRNVTTLVNIFTVEPENQEKLAAALNEGTETFFGKMPGFISSSVLTGKNGRQVTNYSQWRSAGDIEAFRQNPDFRPYIERIAALSKGEAIVCDVAFVHAASS
jgi:heme-degrading monooxygenase HmoA